MPTTEAAALRRHRGALFAPAQWLERRIGLYQADVIRRGNQGHLEHPDPPPEHLQITKKAALALLRLGSIELEHQASGDRLVLRERDPAEPPGAAG